VESSTVGNFAVQLAASEAGGRPLQADVVRRWAQRLCEEQQCYAGQTLPTQTQSA
jgi:hypothetical protein